MLIRVLFAGVGCIGVLSAQAPSVDTFKQVLNQNLQKLLPGGFTERQVLFQEVRAGAPNGTEYPFQATLLIRDYGPGYPANRFYGSTCVGRMDKKPFFLSRNPFGDWEVSGAMTVTLGPNHECKNNPSAGVSSIPWSSLQGTPAAAGNPPPAPPAAAQANSSSVPTGEWACYGSGGTLLIGLGFRIEGNGQYTDLDRKSRGTYTVQAGTISFKGGHLDGQTGSNFRGNKFQMSGVGCETFH